SANRNHSGCAKRLRTRENPARADSREAFRPRNWARRAASIAEGVGDSSPAGENSAGDVFASRSVTPSPSRAIRWTQLDVGDVSRPGLTLLVRGIVISGAMPGATPEWPLGVT